MFHGNNVGVGVTKRREGIRFKDEAAKAERRRHTSRLRSQLFSSFRGCENASLIIENRACSVAEKLQIL